MTWNNYNMGLWTFTYIFWATSLLIAKKEKKYFSSFIIILIFAFLYTINFTYSEPLTSFAFYILLAIIFIFLEFQDKNETIITLVITLYLIRFIFELLFRTTLLILQINLPSIHIITIFTSILTLIFIYTFQEKIKSHIANPYSYKNKSLITKMFWNNIGLFIIGFIRMPHYQIHSDFHTFMNLLLFFFIFNLVFFLFNEKEKNNALQKNYKKIVEYSTFTEGLLTEYKSFIHEYKNKLIVIKGLANEKNIELQKYINTLLEEKIINNNYRWLSELKNIPIAGAKGLINFKLLQMKELNIDVEIYIAEDISKLSENFLTIKEKNDLYTILGIILDNAIEASLESKDKMISLHLYKEKNDVIAIILANTFKHVVIDRMDEKGFSSKGKDRGIGLYLLHNIIKHNDIFSKETSIIDNFFVQKIMIKKQK